MRDAEERVRRYAWELEVETRTVTGLVAVHAWADTAGEEVDDRTGGFEREENERMQLRILAAAARLDQPGLALRAAVPPGRGPDGRT
ncbi:hypothetical protein [Pseudonocardia parietis]|uniref:Uncharacterized protein n=1 Tax=Pseudonocardia parietis TaxID=570936 RepID=A0ABS4VW49_9PSEU|nr:hypothetical protein [Pseudonocardia parietis]MBP2368159.1 hypothetical protein [Pseudonocardia parietis]